MKLKEILNESKEKKRVEKFREIIESDQWLLTEPYIYRGKHVDDNYPLISVKETSERITTRDTAHFIDFIIDQIYVKCYPDFPRRRFSRFATTYSGDALIYGDDVFVVIPHKTATVSHLRFEPFDIFTDLNSRLQAISDDYYRYGRPELSYTDDVTDFIMFLIKIHDKGNLRDDVPVCLSDGLKSKIAKDRSMAGSVESNKLLSEVYVFVSNLLKYFNSLKLGYPPHRQMGREVIFKGKYIEVEQSVFESYQEKYL